MAERSRIGRPLAYCAARLVPRPGVSITADEVHQDYMAWCTRQDRVPLKAGAFRERLAAVARAVAIPVHTDAGDLVLLDTTLRS